MKICYLILAHKNPTQLYKLIKKLNTSNVYFFIHVDKSTDDKPFRTVVPRMDNVFFVDNAKRMITPWSDIAICKVTLLLLKEVLEKFHKNTYCILMSGQDYPIKPNEYIYDFYHSNYGTNFIAINDIQSIWPEWQDRFERYNFHLPFERVNKGIYPIEDRRFFTYKNLKNTVFLSIKIGIPAIIKTMFKKKRVHPNFIIPKGGGTWWALPIETILDILDYIKQNPELLSYHEYTHVPDETLFASIVNKIKDSSEIQETTTYTNWKKENLPLPVTFKKSDISELLEAGSGYLFARKFDIDVDTQIMDILDKIMSKSVKAR